MYINFKPNNYTAICSKYTLLFVGIVSCNCTIMLIRYSMQLSSLYNVNVRAASRNILSCSCSCKRVCRTDIGKWLPNRL